MDVTNNKHIETQTEWEGRMGRKIFSYLRDEIYKDLRFMDVALTGLDTVDRQGLVMFGTDGRNLYFGPEHTIELFRKNEQFLKRAYLHSILHCIYGHLWIGGDRDKRIYNISCDIAIEKVLDSINKPCTKRILTLQRKSLYEELNKKDIVSAGQIYEYIVEKRHEMSEMDFENLLIKLNKEFIVDDHHFWPEKKDKSISKRDEQTSKEWQSKARQILHNKSFGNNNDEEEINSLNINVEASNRHNYRDFLLKFTNKSEVLGINADEFDMGFYNYGFSLYKNMPLIEPLETKQDNRIKDFIIAVDTSYSTSGQLVKNFLEQTLEILKENGDFLKNSRVRILQCDDGIRDDIIVSENSNIDEIFREFNLKGGGNTDFRPVFSYVNELINSGTISEVDGLVYFTDGKGIYPKAVPQYKTAFVFLEGYEGDKEFKVPSWCYREVIYKSSLERYER